MFRAHRASFALAASARLLTPLLVTALLLSAMSLAPAPVQAGGSSTAATIRAQQLKAETSMRRADKQIQKLQRLRRNHTKLLRQAKHQLAVAQKQRDGARRKSQSAHARLDHLEVRLARATRVRPNPKGSQTVDKPALRKQIRKVRTKVRGLDRALRVAERKVETARALKQSRWQKPSKARLAKRIAERERAEDLLGGAINAGLSLAKTKAGQFGISASSGLRKPVAGSISQAYGCTGYPANPRRGSCRHFHDGLDIAAPRGRPVRAAADGYVAYVGFSPWDPGARAFVVIIGHSRGYETVYAHLQPNRRVRTGQKVARGEVIGRVGLTGLTTGPHVHWEVKRSGTTVNPLAAVH